MRRVRSAELRGLVFASILALAGVFFALVMIVGCGRHPSKPAPSDGGWTLEWRSPRGGDTVGGEVTLEVELPAGVPVDELRFLVDGEVVGTARAAPWRITWSARETGAVDHSILAVEAYRRGERVGEASAIDVVVEPDAAPLVEVTLPGRALWLEQGRGTEVIASAVDPEEGALTAASVAWITEILPHPITGLSLHLDELPSGPQRVAVEARDRWRRAGRVEFHIAPFTYREALRPEDCVWNLAAALQAMDAARLRVCLSDEMLFFPCGAEDHDDGEVWSEHQLLEGLAAWLDDPRVSRVECQWEIGPAQPLERDHERHAFCEVHEVSRRHLLDASPVERAGPPSGRVVSSREGRMTFELEENADARWRVLIWREEAPRVGPSLADLLRAITPLPREARPLVRPVGPRADDRGSRPGRRS